MVFDPPPSPGAGPPAAPPPDHDPFASPTTPRVDAIAASGTELVPGWNGRRIAGGLLLIHALTTSVDTLFALRMGDELSPRVAIPIVFDVVIGLSLLAQQDRFLAWAIFRAAVGAIVFSIASALEGNYCGVPMQLLVSGSLLGLLVGDATRPRMIVSLLAYGLYLVTFVGLVVLLLLADSLGVVPPP